MTMQARSRQLFQTPFSKAYWRLAVSEIRNVRVLAVAGVLLALRIAIKPLAIQIPLSQDLYFSFDFLVNSIASMIAGPFVSLFAGAVSDTIGAIFFPKGPYFFPYIFQEMASSLIYALFYYRANLSSLRIILGRFFVSLICNIGLQALIGYYYYQTFYPNSMALYGTRTLAGVVKNLVLFPLEALILILLLNALMPVTNKMELTFTERTRFKLHKKEIILLIVLALIAVASIVLYILYKVNGG